MTLALLALPSFAAGDWHQPVAGSSPLNSVATRNATNPSLTLIGGIPYVAWNEDTSQPGSGSSSTIHVAQLAANGNSWTKAGETSSPPISLLPTSSSESPSLADVGGTPWVAWQEGVTGTDVEIRVAKLGQGSWAEVPATSAVNHPVNHDRTAADGGGHAFLPTLADDATGHPFVSFFEADPWPGAGPQSLFFGGGSSPAQVRVDQLNPAGNGWNEVGGGSVNADPTHDAAQARMTVINGVPWVVYFQVSVGGGGPQLSIDVAHLNAAGNAWVQVGPVATGSPSEFAPPTIANIGGTPYVAFGDKGSGSNLRATIYSFDGANWNLVGGAPASSATANVQRLSIAGIGGTPWVAWADSSSGSTVQTARLIGGSWQVTGSALNDNTAHSTDAPSLASINGIPWVGFTENDGTVTGATQCCNQVRVSRLEPTFLSQSSSPSDTAASLLSKVQTFGLPYSVGFQWGPGSSLTGQTPATATAGDPDFGFKSISGLQPSSLYTFAPFATAGTHEPLVEGPVNAFVTAPAGSSQPTGATGPAGETGPAGKPGGTGAVGANPQLFALILKLSGMIRGGHSMTVRYFVSVPSAVTLQIRHGGRVVAELHRTVGGGTHRVTWDARMAGRRAPTGGYGVVLLARSSGRSAHDDDGFRIIG
jgi:hypothetical protein